MSENKPGYANHSALGTATATPQNYSPESLLAIPRRDYRATIAGINAIEMYGDDVWHCYELSWLNARGKPMASGLRIVVPAASEKIFESKSLKLYLGSLNFHKFDSEAALLDLIKRDLQACTDSPLEVTLYPESSAAIVPMDRHTVLLDELDIGCEQYLPDSSLLQLKENTVENESLLTHLLRTNCPVTGQPDWASLHILYSGVEISRESLLRYIVSYRNHCGFHEQSVEKIYSDLSVHCQPSALSVHARYTRRGGIDISPFRSNQVLAAPTQRCWRQ